MEIQKSIVNAVSLLNGCNDYLSALLNISEEILNHLNADSCIFFSVDADEVIPDMSAVVGKKPQAIASKPSVNIHNTMSFWAVQNGLALILGASKNDPRYDEELKLLGGMQDSRPVIISVPLICVGSLVGVMDILVTSRPEVKVEELVAINPLINIAALIYSRRYSNGLTKLAEISVQLLEGRDYYTHGHSMRVANYSLAIAEKLGLSELQKQKIRLASVLHDIGKLTFSDTLFKADRALTKLELKIIEMHPIIGANIISEINKSIATIIRSHHEHYDGSGYPDGLKGRDIPLLSMIIAVTDAFDAMMTERPYQQATDAKTAIEEIKNKSGSQFSPEVVNILLECYNAGKLQV
ncbi:MAG: HD domain-containing phosphohydrolase [Planctomycetota bacterium]